MHDFLKGIWLVLWIFTLLGVFSLVPLDKYEKDYVTELRKIKSEPQRRLDATYRYIEAVEDGKEDISNGILAEPPAKYYDNYYYQSTASKEVVKEKKYSRPLYVRDKNNPNILYPYPGPKH